MTEKFTVWVGKQRLVFHAVDNEVGVTHHMIINGELTRCNFSYAEGMNIRTTNGVRERPCPTGALSKPKASESE